MTRAQAVRDAIADKPTTWPARGQATKEDADE